MDMNAQLPVATPTRKTALFSIYDERLNMFINEQDMGNSLERLAVAVEAFANRMPIVNYVLNWPPVDIMLECSSVHSPLRVLYDVLFDQLSESGFPVTALISMVVLKHAPRKNTLLAAPTHVRIGGLH